MTTKHQKKKNREIAFARKTGKLLGESWKVESSRDEDSWPDLIVTTESGKFGLEVREIYLDELRKGSDKTAIEIDKKKAIDKLAKAYYKTTCSHAPVRVKFLGDIGNHEKLLSSITNEVYKPRELEQKRIEPYDNCSIYIQRLPDHFGEYKIWDYVSDKVDWGEQY